MNQCFKRHGFGHEYTSGRVTSQSYPDISQLPFAKAAEYQNQNRASQSVDSETA